jgi:hypothetical protein
VDERCTELVASRRAIRVDLEPDFLAARAIALTQFDQVNEDA